MLLGMIVGMIEMPVIAGVWIKYGVLSIGHGGKKGQLLLVASMGVLTVFMNMLLFGQNFQLPMQMNLTTAYALLAILAGIDYKRKLIPNIILGAGFLARALLLVYEWAAFPELIKGTCLNSAAGLLFGLFFLLLLSFLTRHGIGYGDVKMFAWLGFCVGVFDTYYILFYSVLAAAIAGVYLLLVKKVEKRKELPFAPFVFVGFYLVFSMKFLQGRGLG